MMNTNDKRATEDKSAKPKKPGVDASQIKPSMPVVCSDGGQFAIVDHMEGASTIKLNKDTNNVHHYIPLSWVESVDDKVHVDRPGNRAMREWTTTPPTRA